MNATANAERIPLGRFGRHGGSPLALLATIGLALVLGVMAVVLLQGGPAQGQQLGPTAQSTARIFLTFDDGPVRGNTGRVLNVLSDYGVKATFFVVGKQARWYPRLVKREYAEGHSVQNHTYTHPDLTALSNAGVRRELRRTNRAIKATGVPRPHRFRPPYGATNARVNRVGASLGLTQTLWSVDPHDWADPAPSVICRRVVSNASPGSIVLLHDGTGANTDEALPCIIRRLEANGYTFGKL
jgi:peptidoglycan/xylan/chitin deacetylase (PgdA/CDA1 family)